MGILVEILRILTGLGTTLLVCLVSFLFSVLIGYIFGFILNSKLKLVRFVSRIYLEFFRIMPQLVLLYIFYFTVFSNIDPVICSIIVFSLWGISEMGDLVRGTINSIAQGQIEAGKSIGLTNNILRLKVIIPLTIKPLIPNSINLFTRMVKTTSLISLISAVDLLKVVQQISDFNTRFFHDKYATLTFYFIAFFLYFLVCFPLSLVERAYIKKAKN